ncbi:phage tail tape measure protein [Sphingomonas sp. CFBP 8764]|uniref:phage tail tape measure protein n=1 Tax=Sphingomonas sp. CFBP 8764 TaxID=2775275 RepID=UPI00177CC6AF|nr:phage tail tape measure protein [Sphingomonas sp. CFBP 8764]MBD8549487.1 phage tail tape measure protein [Sphingomonas sp. CFBP 8764]
MAASAIGALRVTLGIDTAAFTDGLSAAQKRMSATSEKLKAVGGKIALVGAGMSAALTGPLAAFGKGAFTAASDAAELQSSFDTTFGKMSSTMNKWAESTGDAMGRSTQEMQTAANTFGIFFNTAVDPAKAAQMSQTFAKLAQDLGSFYNVDTETAIEKLRSGLSGENEPLRDFGVFLTEATVKAKGLQLGLTGVGNEFTEQEKITARYALIMEATTKAQGDVVRTASGTANQMRATKAAFEELQVTVGTKLLPALTPLITTLGAVLTTLTSLPAPVQTGIVAVVALGAALGPVTIGVGGLVAAFSTVVPALAGVTTFLTASLIPAAIATAPVWAPIAAAVGLAAGAFALLIKYQPQIDAFGAAVVARMRALYVGVKTWLSDKLNAIFDSVRSKVSAVGDAFYKLWDRVVGHSYVPDMVDEIGNQMSRLDGNMVSVAGNAAAKTAETFQALAARVGPLLDKLFPDQAKFNAYQKNLADLKALANAGGLTPSQLDEAQTRLGREYNGADVNGPTGGITEPDFKPITDGADELISAMDPRLAALQSANDKTAESYANMARDVAGSFQSLVNNIKSGDWLSALTSVLDIVGQVSGILKGTSVPATRTYSVGATPGFATGGSFQVQGMRGVDANMLALNGQPIARVSHGETVGIGRGGNGGSGGVMEVRLRDEMLDARIISGSSRVTQAGIQQNNSQQSKFAGRKLGRG